jgi:hypothetical protein
VGLPRNWNGRNLSYDTFRQGVNQMASIAKEGLNTAAWMNPLAAGIMIGKGEDAKGSRLTQGQRITGGLTLAMGPVLGTVGRVTGFRNIVNKLANARRASAGTIDGLRGEIGAAKLLRALGHEVEFLEDLPGAADLMVGGRAYDVYTPTTGNIHTIMREIEGKRFDVVLNVSRSAISSADLSSLSARLAGKGFIRDLIIVGR